VIFQYLVRHKYVVICMNFEPGELDVKAMPHSLCDSICREYRTYYADKSAELALTSSLLSLNYGWILRKLQFNFNNQFFIG